MANNLTDVGENQLLVWQLSNGTLTGATARPTAWYVSLHTTTTTGPTEASPTTDEVSTANGYARQQVGGASGFTVTGSSASNPATLTFGPNTTSNWGTITHAGVFTAVSGANYGLWTGTLTASKTVNIGDSLTIAASALTLTLD